MMKPWEFQPTEPLLGFTEEDIVTYVAVGPYCWGKGTTPAQAKRNASQCKPSWVKRAHEYDVFLSSADASMDAMGRLEANRLVRISGLGNYCMLDKEIR